MIRVILCILFFKATPNSDALWGLSRYECVSSALANVRYYNSVDDEAKLDAGAELVEAALLILSN